MEKYKYLFKNIGLLTISNFGSKILSFLFVPFYTSILSTAEYGTYDLLCTTIALLIPIVTSGIIEAVFRFLLDECCDRQEIVSVSLKIVFRGVCVFALLLALNYAFNVFPIVNTYLLYFIATFLTSVALQLLQAMARGIGEVAKVATAGIIHSATLIAFNLLFLLGLKMGLQGYFVANILAEGITCAFLGVRVRIQDYIRLKSLNKHREYEMLAYSRPLVLNSISWWIISVSNRYVVTWIWGVAENGIYSVAYKIPSMLSMIQSIFNSAWQISTVKTYDKDDSDGFFKNIYSSYNVIMVLGCSVLIVLTKFLARILYANQFYEAWRYVPFLIISVVFGALLGVLGGVFHAVKDTKMQTVTTVAGSVANIVLNLILTPWIGPIGAALSTMFVYFLMWAMAFVCFKKYMAMKVNIVKDCFAYGILVIQAVIMVSVANSVYLYVVQSLLFITLLLLYARQIFDILRKGLSFIPHP